MKKKPTGSEKKRAQYRHLYVRREGGKSVIYYQRRAVQGKRRVRFSCKTNDWDTAAAIRDAWEAKHGDQRSVGFLEAVPTFAEVAKRALAGMADLKPTTRADRLGVLRPDGTLTAYFGDRPIDTIDLAALKDWWDAEIVGKQFTAKTGRNRCSALSMVFLEAQDRGWIDKSPLDAFRTVVLRRHRRTAAARTAAAPGRHVHPLPTPAAIDAFLAASRAIGGTKALIDLLLLDGGLRLGEAFALTWDGVVETWGRDASDPNRALVIRGSLSRGKHLGTPKSGRERTVALSRRLRAGLREAWMRVGQPANGRVAADVGFSHYRQRHFKRVCEAAGLDAAEWSPKDLRDTYASWLLTVGVQLAYISKQLGHADVGVTARHYARWAEGAAYRDPMLRLPGEVPADLLARLGEASAPAAAASLGVARES